jgi:hypothetical protein
MGRVALHRTLEGVAQGSMHPLLYGRDDHSGALDRRPDGSDAAPCVPGGELQRREAVKLGVNLLMYGLTSNYKQDQAHVEQLIREGMAYVDSQSQDEIRHNRGDYHRPGVDSPYRTRTVDENLDLFRRMRAGELLQVQALSAETDIVMLGIGGNDAGFSEVFAACRTEDAAACVAAGERMKPQAAALSGTTYQCQACPQNTFSDAAAALA